MLKPWRGCYWVPTDVSDETQLAALVDRALAITGQIDFWVNNAGVMASGKIEEIPIKMNH